MHETSGWHFNNWLPSAIKFWDLWQLVRRKTAWEKMKDNLKCTSKSNWMQLYCLLQTTHCSQERAGRRKCRHSLIRDLIVSYSSSGHFPKSLTDSIQHTQDQKLSQMYGLTRHLQMKWQLSKSSEEKIIQCFMDWSYICQSGRGLGGTLSHYALGITNNMVHGVLKDACS